ncbi:MAG: hypothetical protein KGP28_01090 [Bdellovibrionales bacterium]|nr:hypothetical protein [Bdellovibrionales bacterium]
MFCRVETGFKTDFTDPEAEQILRKIREIHPSLSEKIRWTRKLKVTWMEIDAPRDKVVHAIQAAFKNRVTDWVFTGDLLPSAAGATGTLYDLMQESPFRPGVFHGIEKRKRLSVHDEDALVILDAVQTIMGRKSPEDRVVTGELLLMEGARLIQSDLEWVARNWFAREQTESWSLLSEEELKRNSRFQGEQVAKYLASPQLAVRSKLLQFRSPSRPQDLPIQWSRINELLRARLPDRTAKAPLCQGDEWSFISDMRFSSSKLQLESLIQTEFQLCRHQLEHFDQKGEMRLQTLLGVLPEKNRLWRSEIEGESPLKVRDDFESAIERVAESTNTPVAVMKVLEEGHESLPAYFWTGSVSLFNPGLLPPNPRETGSISELLFVGYSDQGLLRNLTYLSELKSVFRHAIQGEALDFSIHASGRSLLQCLKGGKSHLQYGMDLQIDGVQEWFKRFFESGLSLGFIWGINPDKREWVFHELGLRGVPFLSFGTTTLTGDVRILEGGSVKAGATIQEFFGLDSSESRGEESLLEEPLFLQEDRRQPSRFRNRFATEELILKPEVFHTSVATPIVIRPSLDSWSGLMVLSDLVDQGFSSEHLDYLLRKCTAMGGQINSIQVSYLNGLREWSKVLKKVEREYGIQVTEIEYAHEPDIQAHWMAIQVVAKVSDIRTVRTEELKFVQDRIYWLPGDFEQPGTRWLAGFEGRYQTGLHSAVAIESTADASKGVVDALSFALKKRKLGAEVRLQHHFPGGFFVSVSENERYAIEEEWRVLGVEFEFVGRVTSTPYLVIRNEADQVETLSIEDLL